MTNGKVTVVARFKARPGMEETLRRELLALIDPTTAEDGCINYDLHQSADDKALFMFHENWLSREDLDDHLQMPYLQAFLARTDELLAEPAEISLWKMIS
ncbi:putative quinol monooxygenase [Geotalea uraniireducens]|uniref:Antibiotic biosynthesis monooxygenase n=1 Tax=Geotalea uraniireducens (strain Rf4) TaxID=351605 RepID=A5G7G6_GEOUR|nr:putative quinol monooxygenase [Geotalea uraniireducens]ABQ27734.1 Antibiotic biosynthesis monooxygenase [Geotalea uraniireducens Rf4]